MHISIASPAPIAVTEQIAAEALGMSVAWLRKDRRTARLLPHFRLGTAVRYNLDRCREALAAIEEGGPQTKPARRA